MIRITCMQCNATLEMDDAFAGGACRCQHCGTIQTVPGRKSAAAQTPGKPPKALYQQRARTDAGSGTGLDELADLVASSGLSASRLRSMSATSKAALRKQLPVPILAAAAGVVIVLLGVIAWMAMSQDSADHIPGASNRPVSASAPRRPTGFCGIKLTGPVVTYLLDRGSGTQPYFGFLKEVTYRSISQLGGSHSFQVIFWNAGGDLIAYPPAVPGQATDENVAACRQALDEVFAFGQTDIAPALRKAIAHNPDEIVIATGKAWELDESFLDSVEQICKDRPVKIHGVALGGAGGSGALKTLSQKTGGEFREVSEGELRDMAR